MFKTPGGSISVALKKLLPGGRGQVRLYTSLQQREQAVWRTSKIRYWVKKFSILCMGRCTPLGPQLLSKHHEGGKHLLDPVLRALIYTWRLEIADGSDISYLLIWQEIFSFHNVFHYVLQLIFIVDKLRFFNWNFHIKLSKINRMNRQKIRRL